MATLIPSLGSARFDSRGELRLAERLKDFLEDTSYIWHNLPMGPRGRHPDFVIVHPSNGLLVLEVKDWRLDTLVGANKSEVELLTTRGVVKEISPFEQARRYMFDVMKGIQRDPALLFPPGHEFQGKAIVPFRAAGGCRQGEQEQGECEARGRADAEHAYGEGVGVSVCGGGWARSGGEAWGGCGGLCEVGLCGDYEGDA